LGLKYLTYAKQLVQIEEEILKQYKLHIETFPPLFAPKPQSIIELEQVRDSIIDEIGKIREWEKTFNE
jgi:hypothetical protein